MDVKDEKSRESMGKPGNIRGNRFNLPRPPSMVVGDTAFGPSSFITPRAMGSARNGATSSFTPRGRNALSGSRFPLPPGPNSSRGTTPTSTPVVSPALKVRSIVTTLGSASGIRSLKNDGLNFSEHESSKSEFISPNNTADNLQTSSSVFSPKPDIHNHNGNRTLPEGWEELFASETGRVYYYNSVTNVTQWELPPLPLKKYTEESSNVLDNATGVDSHSAGINGKENEKFSERHETFHQSTTQQLNESSTGVIDKKDTNLDQDNNYGDVAKSSLVEASITESILEEEHKKSTPEDPIAIQSDIVDNTMLTGTEIISLNNLAEGDDNENLKKENDSSEAWSNAGIEGSNGNTKQHDTLPDGWEEMIDASSGMPYYFDRLNNITQWERPQLDDSVTKINNYTESTESPEKGVDTLPSEESNLQSLSDDHITDDVKMQHVLGDEWIESVDPDSGNLYYYNCITGVTQWERPQSLPYTDNFPVETNQQEVIASDNIIGGKYTSLDQNITNQEEVIASDNISGGKQILEASPTDKLESSKPGVTAGANDEGKTEGPYSTSVPPDAVDGSSLELHSGYGLNESPLPAGWIEASDENTGNVYYYNTITNETRWERPNNIKIIASSDLATDSAIESINNYEGDAIGREPGVVPTDSLLLEESRDHTGIHRTSDEVDEQADIADKSHSFPDNKTTPEETFDREENLVSEKHSLTLDENPSTPQLHEEVFDASLLIDENNGDLTLSLPTGWIELVDESTKLPYYLNEATGETQWDRPTIEESRDNTVSHRASDEVDEQADIADKSHNFPDNKTTPEETFDREENLVSEKHSLTFDENPSTPQLHEEVSDASQLIDENTNGDLTLSLPTGWIELVDESTELPYYLNEATGETQWDRPTIDESRDNTVSHRASDEVDEQADIADKSHNSPDNKTTPEETFDREENLVSEKHNLTLDGNPSTPQLYEEVSDASHLIDENTNGDRSLSLPTGWIELVDESTKLPYYLNEATCETQWDRPTIEESRDNTVSHRASDEVDEQADIADKSHNFPDNKTTPEETFDREENLVSEKYSLTFDENPSTPQLYEEVSDASQLIDENTNDDLTLSLPTGWIELVDESTELPYYLNEATCETQWDRPTIEESRDNTVSHRASDEVDEQADIADKSHNSPDNKTTPEETFDREENLVSEKHSLTLDENPSTPQLHEEVSDASQLIDENTNDDRSLSLPTGWIELVDESTELPYYLNEATGETQWDRPTIEESRNNTVSHRASDEVDKQADIADKSHNFPDNKTTPEETFDREENLVSEKHSLTFDENPSTPQLYEEVSDASQLIDENTNDDLTLSLPTGWIELVDESTELPYYLNEATGETQWDRPTIGPSLDQQYNDDDFVRLVSPETHANPDDSEIEQAYTMDQPTEDQNQYDGVSSLPEGWVSYIDEASGLPYYVNEMTGAVQWEPPEAESRDHQDSSLINPLDAGVTSEDVPVSVPSDDIPDDGFDLNEQQVNNLHLLDSTRSVHIDYDVNTTSAIADENTEPEATSNVSSLFVRHSSLAEKESDSNEMKHLNKEEYGEQATDLGVGSLVETDDNTGKTSQVDDDFPTKPPGGIDNSMLATPIISDTDGIVMNQDGENNALQTGWFELIDESTGLPYYLNEATGETQWDRPTSESNPSDGLEQEYNNVHYEDNSRLDISETHEVPNESEIEHDYTTDKLAEDQNQYDTVSSLPKGWLSYIDEASGLPYYVNEISGAVQWERPEAESRDHQDQASIVAQDKEDSVPGSTPSVDAPTDTPDSIEGLAGDSSHPSESLSAGKNDRKNLEPAKTSKSTSSIDENSTLAPDRIDTSNDDRQTYVRNSNVSETVTNGCSAVSIQQIDEKVRPTSQSDEDFMIFKSGDIDNISLPNSMINLVENFQLMSQSVNAVELLDPITTSYISEIKSNNVQEPNAGTDKLPPVSTDHISSNDADKAADHDSFDEMHPIDLPSGWVELIDEATSMSYYFHKPSGTTQWERPDGDMEHSSNTQTDTVDLLNRGNEVLDDKSQDLATKFSENENPEGTSESSQSAFSLPAGWTELVDETTGLLYYYHESRGVTQWERPSSESSSPKKIEAGEGQDFDVLLSDSSSAENPPSSVDEQDASKMTSTTTDKDPSTCDSAEANQKVREMNQKLPNGWSERVDESTGRTFYVNEITGSTQWEYPVDHSHLLSSVSEKSSLRTSDKTHNNHSIPDGANVNRNESPEVFTEFYSDEQPWAPSICDFGFGGRLCVHFPASSKQTLVVHRIYQIAPQESLVQIMQFKASCELQGPLISCDDALVRSYIQKMSVKDCDLLWNLIKIASDSKGKLRSENGVADDASPESMIVDLLCKTNSWQSSLFNGEVKPYGSIDGHDDENILGLLLRGLREEAVEEAIKGRKYALALLIGIMCSREAIQFAGKAFASDSFVYGHPLHTLTMLFSGNLRADNATDFWKLTKPHVLRQSWRSHVAAILCNRISGWEYILIGLGDYLLSVGEIIPAHFCFMVSGCPVSDPHQKDSRLTLIGSDIDAFNLALASDAALLAMERTEAFEWSKRRGNNKAVIPSLQAFKFIFSRLLADYGYVEQALSYTQSVMDFIRSKDHVDIKSFLTRIPISLKVLLPNRSSLVKSLDEFQERLHHSISCGIVNNDSYLNYNDDMDSSFVTALTQLHSKAVPNHQPFDTIAEGVEFDQKLANDISLVPVMSESQGTLEEPIATSFADSIQHSKKANEYVPTVEGVYVSTNFEQTKSELSTVDEEPVKSNRSKVQALESTNQKETRPSKDNFVNKSNQVSETSKKEFFSSPATTGGSLGKPETAQKRPPTAPASAPANLERSTKKSPSSGGLTGFIRDSMTKWLNPEATKADLGEGMQAYYDADKKVWVFPGDDPTELAKPVGPPPITPVSNTGSSADGTHAPSNQILKNDPLAAMMLPPTRIPSAQRTRTPGAPRFQISSNVKLQNLSNSPAVNAPNFAVFAPKHTDANETKD